MTLKILPYILIILLAAFILPKYPVPYSYSDFKDYSSILLGVASMIFTIMGIWIAFLYPNALKKIVSPENIENVDFSEALSETSRLESIVASVLKSAIVVVLILLMFLMKLAFYHTAPFTEHIILIKQVIFGFLLILSYALIESVTHVIHANIMFLNDLHQKREAREEENSY